MKQGPRYHVKFRRHREGITDYRKRLKLLKSRKTRVVVRKSLKNTCVQFVEYRPEGDHVLASAGSKELVTKYNWKFSTATTPAAYLTGLLAGKKAKDKGITEVVLDLGRSIPTTGSKLFAALQGTVDAGIACPYDTAKIPAEDRLMGKHLHKDISPAVNDVKSKILGDK